MTALLFVAGVLYFAGFVEVAKLVAITWGVLGAASLLDGWT